MGKIMMIAVLMVTLRSGTAAIAEVPYWELCTATFANYNGGPVGLMVLPNGEGPPFTEASDGYSGTVDGTIVACLYDVWANPVVGYPREDMWLESVDGGMALCSAGSIADTDTDATGATTWTAPMSAGGTSEAGLVAMISGDAICCTIDLLVNSPDINGDLEVSLTDVSLFAADYYSGTYHFRSDLDYNGVASISDVAILASAYITRCP